MPLFSNKKVNLINKLKLSYFDKSRGITLEKIQEGVLISNNSNSDRIISISKVVQYSRPGSFLHFCN